MTGPESGDWGKPPETDAETRAIPFDMPSPDQAAEVMSPAWREGVTIYHGFPPSDMGTPDAGDVKPERPGEAEVAIPDPEASANKGGKTRAEIVTEGLRFTFTQTVFPVPGNRRPKVRRPLGGRARPQGRFKG